MTLISWKAALAETAQTLAAGNQLINGSLRCLCNENDSIEQLNGRRRCFNSLGVFNSLHLMEMFRIPILPGMDFFYKRNSGNDPFRLFDMLFFTLKQDITNMTKYELKLKKPADMFQKERKLQNMTAFDEKEDTNNNGGKDSKASSMTDVSIRAVYKHDQNVGSQGDFRKQVSICWELDLGKPNVFQHSKLINYLATLRSIRHENINPFVGSYPTPQSFCLLYEFCRRRSLEFRPPPQDKIQKREIAALRDLFGVQKERGQNGEMDFVYMGDSLRTKELERIDLDGNSDVPNALWES
ncbi:hypothetical protein ACTXT7_000898 [Hymenolepis weldensis]